MANSPARAYAERVTGWGPRSWWEMEVAALTVPGAEVVHDAVLVRGPVSLTALRRTRGSGCFISLLTLASMFVPLITLGFLLFVDPDEVHNPLIALAIAVAAGVIVLVINTIVDFTRGVPLRVRGAIGLLMMIGIPAAVDAWIIWVRLENGLLSPDVMWTLLPFATTTIGLLLLLVLAAMTAPARRASVSFTEYQQGNVRNLDGTLNSSIRADLSQAIDVLVVRGAIAPAAALRAKSAHLGELAITMAPEVASHRQWPGAPRAAGAAGSPAPW